MNQNVEKFISDQLSVWPEAAARYRALKNAQLRKIQVDGVKTVLQFNPDRVRSSNAKTDPESVSKRPCFLCASARPAEQRNFKFEGRKGRQYMVTLNPYPIFPGHLVLASEEHTPQSIWHRFTDMTDMAREYDDDIIMYNGPQSGASCPDHMHFQAVPKGYLPLEAEIEEHLDRWQNGNDSDFRFITSIQDAKLFHYKHFCHGVFALKASTAKSLAKLFYRLLDCADLAEGMDEPMINCFTWFSKGEFRCFVIFRTAHRSHHYFSEGPDHLMMSPGCADMAGFFVIPMSEDFQKLNGNLLKEVLEETATTREHEEKIIWRLTRTQPTLRVGIMSGEEIEFEIISDGAGTQKVSYQEGKINYNGALYDELVFEASTISTLFAEPSFILYGVTIGVDFHWQRKVTQKFAGKLRFIVEHGKITAINEIGVEDYLLSVISSEMKASATLEFLKAHSVISRSWVMSQISGKGKAAVVKGPSVDNVPQLVTWLDKAKQQGGTPSAKFDGEFIKWFDHDDHKNFDVCADDHCQRYQGIGMAAGENVRKAIDFTWGQVMMSEGEIVDARFSKSCGGMMEKFSTCWEDKDYPYLQGITDTAEEDTVPDLTDEKNASEWILSSPESFCNTTDKEILGQVLNDYDLETKDFYRWKQPYTLDEVSELYARRSGMDLGQIVALIPVERGVSGRLKRMKVVGTKASLVIGKELIIRRYLSESHLFSSAFVVKYYDASGAELTEAEVLAVWEGNGKIAWSRLELIGAGWGHGAGLCQIGAAVMAYRGYTYDRILQHYYPTSELVRK